MLHMYPEKLKLKLDHILTKYEDYKIVLLYGDCHARMINHEKCESICRTQGMNCCEIFLGKDQYRKLRKEGAFIMLHEWASRWRDIFYDYMGFKDNKTASLFMQDMHEKIVYLDTSFQKVDYNLLKEISNFTGLKVEVIQCEMNNLEKGINQCINKLSKGNGE